MDQNFGKLIVYVGLLIIVVGVVVYFFHDKLGWIGRLPGDIRIEKENSKFYFPITTMILLSILVNVLIRIFRNLFS